MAFGPLSLRPVLCGVIGLLIVLSGCSGGGHGAQPPAARAPGTTVAPTGAIGAPSAGSAPGPDDQQLQTLALVPSDLPAGWAAKPSGATASEAAAGLALAQCLGQRNIGVDLVANVVSQDYSKGALVITSSARSYLSDDDVIVATASFSNPKAVTCYQQRLAPPGATVTKVTPGPSGGPDNVVATIAVSSGSSPGAPTTPPKTVKGSKTTTRSAPTVKPVGLTGTIVFITGPRLMVEIDFFGVDAEVPAQLRSEVVAKVAARAARG